MLTGNLRMEVVVVESWFSICCEFGSFESESLSLTVNLQNQETEPVTGDVAKAQSPQWGLIGQSRLSSCLL